MNKEIYWEVKTFDQLTISQLYAILHLRSKVFVVEQNSPYLDVDYKDQKAQHVMGYADTKLIAYSRLFDEGDYIDEASIGRVVVDKEYRMENVGNKLLLKNLELMKDIFKAKTITISAQLYLRQFYENHGFAKITEPYLEDGIPHIGMRRIE